MTKLEELRSVVAAACRSLFELGQMDVRGHASARREDGRGMLILAHLHEDHRVAAGVGPNDIIDVSWEEDDLTSAGSYPNEAFIHSGIYQSRPDVGGIVHVHPLFATALSTLARGLAPISQVALALGEVGLFADPWSVNTAERGRMLATALGSRRAVLMQGHGVTVVGKTVQEAAAAAYVLEDAAKLEFISTVWGAPRELDTEGRNSDLHRRWQRAVTEELLPTAWAYMTFRIGEGAGAEGGSSDSRSDN